MFLVAEILLNKKFYPIIDDFIGLIFFFRHRIFRNINLPLPINQFSVLMLLSYEGKMTPSQVSQRLLIIKQQLTPILHRLGQNGLIERRSNPHDKRCTNIYITDKGKKFVTKHEDQIKARLACGIVNLTPEEVKKFSNALTVLRSLSEKFFSNEKDETNA